MSIEASVAHPSVAVHDGWLRVVFDDGEHADYHLRWLRHFADEVRHPQTGERLRCSSELDDALSLRAARVRGDALELVWEPDGERSRHPLRLAARARLRPGARGGAAAAVRHRRGDAAGRGSRA